MFRLKKITLLLGLLISLTFVQASQWPTINLIATSGVQNTSTIISFNHAMTLGLDLTYDAALLKGSSDLIVYSFLLEGYVGTPFAIQALPDQGYKELIIPIGIDFRTGGDITISTGLVNMSADTKVILEDKLTNSFTDLTKNNYKITVAANYSITDRFLLHYMPQTIWTGLSNSDWNTASNWSTLTIPTAADNVSVPLNTNYPIVNQNATSSALCNNLSIETGAFLTIAPGKALTINGTFANNSITGLIIQSDATGTGSVITANATGTGSALSQSYLTSGAWHMVSSPLSGQTVAGFLTTNTNIALSANNTSRGMMDYDPVNNKWNNFFTDGTGNGSLGSGRGFSLRVGNVSSVVSFSGSLQAGTQIVSTIAGYWNCIGNPYTSAVGINTNTKGTDNFLNENALVSTNLDPSYSAVYIWDKTDACNSLAGQYTVISNTPLGVAPIDIQQGQAFCVKINAGVNSVVFNHAMQLHNPTLQLKSSSTIWPNIKLTVSSNDQKSSTYIAFNNQMTKGLDPTYDAGLLKGTSDLVVYSKLVEDNGNVTPFAIQALPFNDNSMIIPIGLNFNAGGEVVFSSELFNIPQDNSVLLEDRLTRTLTDITKGKYKVTVDANSSNSARFFLHINNTSVSLNQQSQSNNLKAYAIGKTEIVVLGQVSNKSIATLYEITGRALITKNLEEGNRNSIPLPIVKAGIYMLSVIDNGKKNGFKILIRE